MSAWSNFTNDSLTTKQKWISFGVDTAYTLGTFGIGYGVGALVSLIPVVGIFCGRTIIKIGFPNSAYC